MDLFLTSTALTDKTNAYRYTLLRQWDTEKPLACFIMLNPSVADADQDDPTIRRCLGFARRWGFGGLEVVNLFAFRSTDPRALIKAADPVGSENDHHIRLTANDTGLIVVAWGRWGTLHDRDRAVSKLLSDVPLFCLGVTKNGCPKHPLYVRATTERALWNPR